jgi:hypothetical protein
MGGRPPIHVLWAALALLALALTGGLLSLGTTTRAEAAAQHTGSRQAAPPPQPDQARWSDPQNGTAFTVELKEISVPGSPKSDSGPVVLHPRGEFWFALNNGEATIHGGDVNNGALSVAGPDKNNMDTLDTTAPVASPGPLANCQSGDLITAQPYVPFAGKVEALVPATTVHPALYILRAQFDDNGLVAYATLSYLATDVTVDPNLWAAFCAGTYPAQGTGTLSSGCNDLTSPCQQPLGAALPFVASFDRELVNAAASGDWELVYKYSAESIQGQYSVGTFTAVARQQVAKAGKITNITPVTNEPSIQIGTVGEPWFAVTQTETVELNGKTSTPQVTSYFLLEQGSWHFWFSQ